MNAKERGFTLIELLVTTAIVSLFFVFVFSSMQAMSTSARAGTASVNATAENQKVVQAINLDLLESAMDRMAVTPTDLTLQAVIGFDDVAGEEVWSTPITYTRNIQNQVVRTQDGVSHVVANGVTALSFASGVVDVTVTVATASGTASNNTDSQVTNSLTVTPKN